MLTDADRRELEGTMKATKNSRMEASNARKTEMQELEIRRKKNEKPSDLEQVSNLYIYIYTLCVYSGIYSGTSLLSTSKIRTYL